MTRRVAMSDPGYAMILNDDSNLMTPKTKENVRSTLENLQVVGSFSAKPPLQGCDFLLG